ncbi:MAG: hypothetical protein HGA85_06300 [Nanoarchaeota archaeon]|nr:hypothetical protein [Nanoarchaeota archaeon]
MGDFYNDLAFVIGIAAKLDSEFSKATPESWHDRDSFSKVIAKWNRKYFHIKLALIEDSIQLRLKIMILPESPGQLIGEIMALSPHARISRKVNELVVEYTSKDDKDLLAYINEEPSQFSLVHNNKSILDESTLEYCLVELYAKKGAANIALPKNSFSFDTGEESSEGLGIGYLNTYRFYDN